MRERIARDELAERARHRRTDPIGLEHDELERAEELGEAAGERAREALAVAREQDVERSLSMRRVAHEVREQRADRAETLALFVEHDPRHHLPTRRHAREPDLLQVEVLVQHVQVVHLRDVVVVRVVPEERHDRALPRFGETARESDRVQRLVEGIERRPAESRLLAGDDGARARLPQRAERIEHRDVRGERRETGLERTHELAARVGFEARVRR